jgi:hypothetical protein
MCPNFYLLYYLKNIKLTECKTCGHARYKPKTDRGRTFIAYRKLRYFLITPKLQMLLMSPNSTKHMTWHHLHDMVDGMMVHLSDGEVCKHFNRVHP